jgi:2-oxoglutarate-Fe(II)-dependent oxygenase superfamily protein
MTVVSISDDAQAPTSSCGQESPDAHADAMPLFAPDVPEGFEYRDEFISSSEEERLAAEIGGVTFVDFEMRGVVARRRVAFFGETYDRGAASAIPAFLFPLRAAVAAWAHIDAEAFAMALINEYRPGAPIGWHRDAPQYEIVAGISLLAACRMKFRPYTRPGSAQAGPGRRRATHEITLERRSAYLITGAARREYEHHIPAVAALRYSITFRTLRPARSRAPAAAAGA